MLIVGLTGGIGSGKTTAAHFFRELGVEVIDADQIARELVEPGMPALTQIVQHFGTPILDDKGQLQRHMLRQRIFHSAKDRAWLEALLHPVIRQEMQYRAQHATSPYCVMVIPLLFEKGLQNLVHRILLIDVPKELQYARTHLRDDSTEIEIGAIMHTQMTRQQRLAGTDDIIKNDRDIASLKSNVARFHQYYLKLAKTRFCG